MDTFACNYNTLKEGVCLFMKNFFLYIKFKSSEQQICSNDDIYCFKNNRLLAINRNAYDHKNRAELQHTIGMHPYYITQNIFRNFLLCILDENQERVMLKDLRFIDDSIENSNEYIELQKHIRSHNPKRFFENISEIMDLYDTDIKSMVVRYGGYDFSISNEGVMNTDAPKNIIASFVEDEAINNIILGIY